MGKGTKCTEDALMIPPQWQVSTFFLSVYRRHMDSDTHPWIPFFGGLLLNWRVCLCLNLGGPLRGVAGPPVTRVADLISGFGASRFMAAG